MVCYLCLMCPMRHWMPRLYCDARCILSVHCFNHMRDTCLRMTEHSLAPLVLSWRVIAAVPNNVLRAVARGSCRLVDI